MIATTGTKYLLVRLTSIDHEGASRMGGGEISVHWNKDAGTIQAERVIGTITILEDDPITQKKCQ